MSYQGINFANQRLVPSDDGRLYQNIFNDGALYGCQLTYTGTELTISQGHLVIGGRQMKIESAEVVNVNGAVSGFAQIVIAIDLTKTATISTFNQISIEVRYSAAEDGFSTLTQTDINGSGSYYEAQLALLSLGTGGITGIVQDMPRAAFKGAAESGGLNLHVVGGTTQPTSPKENTVWVNTDTEISGYAFSATAPTNPVEGMVWFQTGTTSNAPINIDKKNTVILYPNICQQYINGAWVSKTAKIYSSAKWSELWDGGLYVEGNQYKAITGGWWNNYNLSFKGSSTYPGNSGLNLADSLGDYISLSGKNGYFSSVTTKNKIDLTNFSTLSYDVLSGSATDEYIIFIHSLESGAVNNNSVAQAKTGPVDISSITGSYYITVGALNVRTVKVANLRVE